MSLLLMLYIWHLRRRLAQVEAEQRRYRRIHWQHNIAATEIAPLEFSRN